MAEGAERVPELCSRAGTHNGRELLAVVVVVAVVFVGVVVLVVLVFAVAGING